MKTPAPPNPLLACHLQLAASLRTFTRQIDLKSYLLDTNSCIFYMKGKFDLNRKMASLAAEQLFISEITLAELKFWGGKQRTPG